MAIAKEGIDALDKAVDLYNKILDKAIPWAELNKTIQKLDEFRADYSQQAANLLGTIQTQLKNGMDAYFRATQSVYEWCGLSINLLNAYRKLFNDQMNQDKFNAQRAILLKILTNGIEKMNAAQRELGTAASAFNEGYGKLTALNTQLKNDFDSNSEYYQAQKTRIRATAYGAASFSKFFFLFLQFCIFQHFQNPNAFFAAILGLIIAAGVVEGKMIPELNAKMESIEKFYQSVTVSIQDAATKIDETKDKLKEEVRIIGDLKVEAEEVQTYVEIDSTTELKDSLLSSVANLIASCEKYRSRHSDAA